MFLGVVFQYQREDEWCWAAVASMVAKFLPSSSSWDQCAVANACLPVDVDCCPQPPPDGCNRSWYLDEALKAVQHLEYARIGPIGLSDLIDQIKSGLPVGVTIQFDGGGSHHVLISGYDDSIIGSETLRVNDPEVGLQPGVLYNTLVSGYRGGSWQTTYFTKK